MGERTCAPLDTAALVEVLNAAANWRENRPQKCGHSEDPMCCPFENFPRLAAWFIEHQTAAPQRLRDELERVGRRRSFLPKSARPVTTVPTLRHILAASQQSPEDEAEGGGAIGSPCDSTCPRGFGYQFHRYPCDRAGDITDRAAVEG